ncbi:glutamate receptor ionotropic, delta-2-like [Eriocheir sinensis]|uniref:glutamate receptor ionotropic, delta-2-like n=1 Tax=Eriocheir sinensis TaxID=95602 RepID=UPI0021C8292D|nr:glutamate receptor ionotropic, delta-2-like [Eriocheir sinensis]
MTDGATVFKAAAEGKADANLTHTLLPMMVAQARLLRRRLSWCVTVVVVSDDPVFLSAFAEAADSGRLMVWETRMLVVTRAAKPQIMNLMKNYWTFSMMNTMFLTPTSEYGDERCQLYAHLPYTSTGAQVVLAASWSASHGLVQISGHTIFPEKYKNFHGMSINVTWYPMAPYFMEVRDLDNKTNQAPRYAGRDYIILEGIAEALNFSINVLPYTELDKVLTRLVTRQAYIRPFRVAILPHLIEMFDFTMFIERATLAFGMAKPTLKPSWQSLYYPLQPAVWGSIMASVLLVLSVLLVVKPKGEEKGPEAWLVVKLVVGTLLDEAIPGELPRRSSTRVVLAAWLIFSFIVGTVYRSNLTASLTVPKYPPRAETLADLVDTGAKYSSISAYSIFINHVKRICFFSPNIFYVIEIKMKQA